MSYSTYNPNSPVERDESQVEEFISRCDFDDEPLPFLFHQQCIRLMRRVFKKQNRSVLDIYDNYLEMNYKRYDNWKVTENLYIGFL